MKITHSRSSPSRRRRMRAQFRRQLAIAHRLLGGFWRITIFLGRAAAKYLIRLSCWFCKHIGSPVLCFMCVYLGVMLTMSLPVSMWTWFILPVIANVPAIAPTSFPLATLPDRDTLLRALLGGLPLAVVAFRRTYVEWKISPEPLFAQMLYACYAGVIWPAAWFRRRTSPPDP